MNNNKYVRTRERRPSVNPIISLEKCPLKKYNELEILLGGEANSKIENYLLKKKNEILEQSIRGYLILNPRKVTKET